MLLNLVRPRFFMPVHGEFRHLHFHAELARSTGVPADHIFILDNGDVLELTPDSAAVTERVRAGMIYVDGLATGDFSDVVLRDRTHLSNDGIVIAVVAIRAQDGALAGDPELAFRGFVHRGDLDELADLARARLVESLHSDEMQHITDVTILKAHVHDVLQRVLYRETRRRPMVMPVVVEV